MNSAPCLVQWKKKKKKKKDEEGILVLSCLALGLFLSFHNIFDESATH